MMPDVTVDVNDVIERLLNIVSAQALTIAKLEALNKKLMEGLQGLQGQEKGE